MGRGRAKAKQTKVARDLKYNTGHTDLGALQAELSNGAATRAQDDFDDEKYSDDPYAKYYDDADDDESEEN